MRVPVQDLVGRPGATRHVAASVARDDVGPPAGAWGPADEALRSAIDVDLTLEMLLDGLFAHGSVSFTVTVPCARCLTDVTTEATVPVSELYVDPDRAEETDGEVEEGYEILPEGAVDLEAMLRDAIGSTLPLRQLCDEACRGLCPVCGADLNVEDCGHAQGPGPDPRWGPLGQLQGRLPPE